MGESVATEEVIHTLHTKLFLPIRPPNLAQTIVKTLGQLGKYAVSKQVIVDLIERIARFLSDYVLSNSDAYLTDENMLLEFGIESAITEFIINTMLETIKKINGVNKLKLVPLLVKLSRQYGNEIMVLADLQTNGVDVYGKLTFADASTRLQRGSPA